MLLPCTLLGGCLGYRCSGAYANIRFPPAVPTVSRVLDTDPCTSPCVAALDADFGRPSMNLQNLLWTTSMCAYPYVRAVLLSVGMAC